MIKPTCHLICAILRLSTLHQFSLDPGEMDTEMHAAAMPEADRASLRSPAEVAARIASIVADAESLPNGSRLSVADWGRAA